MPMFVGRTRGRVQASGIVSLLPHHRPTRESDMYVLRIEHPTADYDSWKAAFDSDPVGREAMGVRRYQVLRAADDPHFVCIELAFDSLAAAEALHDAMRAVWKRVAGTVVFDPQVRAFELTEDRSY